MADLQGKTALITGGAVHLGKAIALAMADAGAQVAFTYVDSKDQAEQTLAEIKARGRSAIAVPCDVRNSKSIAAAVEAVQKQHRRAGQQQFDLKSTDRLLVDEFSNIDLRCAAALSFRSRHGLPSP